MKRTIQMLLILCMSILLIGCEQTQPLDDLIPHQDDLLHYVPASYVYPEKFYRDIDAAYFYYANVWIQTPYQYPSQDSIDRQAIKLFYEQHHLEYIQNNAINQWRYHDIYTSSYSPLIILTYSSKQTFFQDFGLIKALLDPSTSITFELHTIGESFVLTQDCLIDDVIIKADHYQNREQTHPNVDYQVMEIMLSIDEDSRYDELGYQNVLLLDSYAAYQHVFTDDRYHLAESFFEENMLILSVSYRSSSQLIKDVAGIYQRDGVIDMALHVEQVSQWVTEDVIRYLVVASVKKEDIDPSSTLELVLHTHYLDGYLSEVPFYIKPILS